MIYIQTKKELPLIAKNGEYAYCAEDKNFYIYYKNHWEKQSLKPEIELPQMSIYELNKIFIKQLPDINLEEAKDILYKFTHIYYRRYFMLLCNDIHYYTVLDFNQEDHDDAEDIVDLIIKLLQYHGTIKSIDYSEDKTALECWIDNKEKDCLMFMLFDYNWGIVQCQ